MKKLSRVFYLNNNVVAVAKDLLGKLLVTKFDGQITIGRITETEAYEGVKDKASHAWNGRRTERTEVMYAKGGAAYVYLCYGVHHLFNVVTNEKNIPHAVLIRALEPVKGVEVMSKRTGKKLKDKTITIGPGNLSRALGIFTAHSGMDLGGDQIFIAADDFIVEKNMIEKTKRIGVEYSGEDAHRLYRFIIRNNPYVSKLKQSDLKTIL